MVTYIDLQRHDLLLSRHAARHVRIDCLVEGAGTRGKRWFAEICIRNNERLEAAMRISLFASAVAGVMALGCVWSQGAIAADAGFGSYQHVGEFANDIRVQSNDVCWEMHRFHQQQTSFTEAYREAKEIYSIAGHVEELVRNHATRDMIRGNV